MTTFSRRHLLGSLSAFALAGCKTSTAAPNTVDQKPSDATSAPNVDFSLIEAAGQRTVASGMTGVNFLYGRDDPYGTWGPRSKRIGAALARWPGGTIAEFDDGFLSSYIVDAHKRNWNTFNDTRPSSLRNFLSFAAGNGLTPTIVLPTKRYIPKPGVINYNLARLELGAFIDAVMGGKFGTTKVPLWEIGNEFYVEPKISAEDYADLSIEILDLLRSKARYPVKIGVQAGNWIEHGISRIDAAFPAAAKSKVDFIIDHIYPQQFSDQNHRGRFRDYRRAWGNKPVYVSEWNIQAKVGGDLNVYDYGMQQAGTMVSLFDDMVAEGVKWSSFWAVQQNNQTSAFHREGEGSEVPYVAGSVVSWLHALAGHTRTEVHNFTQKGAGVWAYRKGKRTTLLVAGLATRRHSIEILMPGRIQSATAIRMHGLSDVAKHSPGLTAFSPDFSGRILKLGVNDIEKQELIRAVIQAA